MVPIYLFIFFLWDTVALPYVAAASWTCAFKDSEWFDSGEPLIRLHILNIDPIQ